MSASFAQLQHWGPPGGAHGSACSTSRLASEPGSFPHPAQIAFGAKAVRNGREILEDAFSVHLSLISLAAGTAAASSAAAGDLGHVQLQTVSSGYGEEDTLSWFGKCMDSTFRPCK